MWDLKWEGEVEGEVEVEGGDPFQNRLIVTSW